MPEQKLSDDLLKRIDADPETVLEIICEIEAPPAVQTPFESGGRAARIAAQKDGFERASAPLEELVQQLGGEVLDRAWINGTLRIRMPAKNLRTLSQTGPVQSLDLPRTITPD